MTAQRYAPGEWRFPEHPRDDGEALLYRLVATGKRRVRCKNGKLSVSAAKGHPLNDDEKQSINEHRQRLSDLVDADADAEGSLGVILFRGVVLYMSDIYRACEGIDITPATELLEKAQDHYENGELDRARYLSWRAVTKARELVDASPGQLALAEHGSDDPSSD